MADFTHKDAPNGQTASKPGEGKARQLWRPKSQRGADDSSVCPFCHGQIRLGMGICPHCGHNLISDKCSFCGSPMKSGAKFCSHCGQSREGVVCPICGTLNARNFCRKCNYPLTAMAQRALTEAKNDPKVISLQKKADELAELHRRIEELRNANSVPDQSPAELSKEDKALLDEYADILGSIGAYKPQVALPSPPQETQRRQYADTSASLDDIMVAFREKAREMDALLASIVPPPEFTPEQQRDYFSARKIGRIEIEYDMSDYSPTMWKCNLCGMLHHCPSECSEPQLGGTWVYVTPEQYREKYITLIKSTKFKIE